MDQERPLETCLILERFFLQGQVVTLWELCDLQSRLDDLNI